MDTLVSYLILLLQEFIGWDSELAKLGAVTSLVIAALSPFGGLWLLILKQRSSYAAKNALLSRDLKAAESSISALNQRVSSLDEFAPATVIRNLAREKSDNNYDRLVREADRYLTHHRQCFAETCQILTDHHLSRFEDGLDGLRRARATALGVLAAKPNDREAELQLDEIERLQRVESATPENEEEVRDLEERLRLQELLEQAPSDLDGLLEVGRKQNELGCFRRAEVILKRAERICLAGDAPGFKSTWHHAIDYNLGWCDIYAGRYADAEARFADLLKRKEEAFGCDDRPTFTTRCSLATAILDQDRPAEAEAILRELLPIEEKVMGQEHPDTLTTRHELARATFDQDLPAKAEAMLTKLLPLMEKVKGQEHPDTLTTRQGLARVTLDQDLPAEAEAMLTRLLPLMEKVNGKEHPHTLTTRHTLARAILDQDLPAEAEAMLTRLLPLMEKVNGKEHPHTLTTRHTLARAILDQDRPAEAEAMLKELLPVEEKVKGKEHPHTLLTRYFICVAILDQGQREEAERGLAELLPIEEQVWGMKHSNPKKTRKLLARVRKEMKAQNSEA